MRFRAAETPRWGLVTVTQLLMLTYPKSRCTKRVVSKKSPDESTSKSGNSHQTFSCPSSSLHSTVAPGKFKRYQRKLAAISKPLQATPLSILCSISFLRRNKSIRSHHNVSRRSLQARSFSTMSPPNGGFCARSKSTFRRRSSHAL